MPALPAQLTTFVGRDGELRQVGGAAGAQPARDADRTGRHRQDTAGHRGRRGRDAARSRSSSSPRHGGADVAGAVLGRARACARARAAAPQDPVDRLISALRDRAALLVLDNCEHVVDVAARLAARLLAACPGLRVLATSREPLGITGEQLAPVPRLAVPPPGTPAVQASAYPAVRLFADRAAASDPAFARRRLHDRRRPAHLRRARRPAARAGAGRRARPEPGPRRDRRPARRPVPAARPRQPHGRGPAPFAARSRRVELGPARRRRARAGAAARRCSPAARRLDAAAERLRRGRRPAARSWPTSRWSRPSAAGSGCWRRSARSAPRSSPKRARPTRSTARTPGTSCGSPRRPTRCCGPRQQLEWLDADRRRVRQPPGRPALGRPSTTSRRRCGWCRCWRCTGGCAGGGSRARCCRWRWFRAARLSCARSTPRSSWCACSARCRGHRHESLEQYLPLVRRYATDDTWRAPPPDAGDAAGRGGRPARRRRRADRPRRACWRPATPGAGRCCRWAWACGR